MIASVAAEDPDGGVDRQRGQFAQLLHARVALLAIAQGFVLIRRIRRNICVVRRHAARPVFNRPCRTLDSVAVSLDTAAEPGRTTAGYCSFSPSSLPLDRLMKSSKLRAAGGLIQRFRHQSNSENRLFGLVQKLHLPLGVFVEFAGDAADHIAANAGQLFPCSFAVGKFGAVIGSAGVAAISDAEEIERHGYNRCMKAAPSL